MKIAIEVARRAPGARVVGALPPFGQAIASGDLAYDEPSEGMTLTRIHVEVTFSGDIEAEGVVEFLQAASAHGTASFVGIERVDGTLAGRRGTFLLPDAGTVEGNVVSRDWFVVPGSGTGELSGLRGSGGFHANLGEGADVHLDYWFD